MGHFCCFFAIFAKCRGCAKMLLLRWRIFIPTFKVTITLFTTLTNMNASMKTKHLDPSKNV